MAHTLSDAEEEQLHFNRVIITFHDYEKYSLAANNRRRKDLYTLPQADQALLARVGYKGKLDAADAAIAANARFLRAIVANPEIFGHNVDAPADDDDPPASPAPAAAHARADGAGHAHTHTHGHTHAHDAPRIARGARYRPTDFDMDKLRSTLKQFVRDWSAEGRAEREACYTPMKDALLEHFADIPPEERGNFKVLVPGAGLARLAFDIAGLGFACQGNEFSHYMLLASYFVLNKTDAVNAHTIHPYVHSFSNLASRAALLRAVSIPDVLPTSLPPGSDFSLVAGDFEEIYGAEDAAGTWDAILTCFFIDTAKNVVNYLRVIHRALAPGGVWINLGPLLWHFENNGTGDPSVELDLAEVTALARAVGFQLHNERRISTTYTSNAQGMLAYEYHAAFWTATKVV